MLHFPGFCSVRISPYQREMKSCSQHPPPPPQPGHLEVGRLSADQYDIVISRNSADMKKKYVSPFLSLEAQEQAREILRSQTKYITGKVWQRWTRSDSALAGPPSERAPISGNSSYLFSHICLTEFTHDRV